MKNILDELTEDQAQIALEIARKAKEMGVDPRLAVALAYRESGLNPKAKGSSGEVGLMQVMPRTAKGMGFTPEELADPAKNIEIGLTYLKRGLEKFDGDPVLAAAGYNAGLDHPYFSDPDNKSLPASTKEYLKGINGLGGFSATAAEPEEPEPTPVPEPASEEDFMQNKKRMMADLIAAGSGALIGKGLDVGKNLGATGQAIQKLPAALNAAQGMPGMAPTAPSAPSAAPGMARPVVGGPAGPVGGPASPLSQMGGSATANYGKAFGLTDIEANRALDMSKQPGGASDLINQRREALQKIQQMGGGYVENPRYGGIMTPEAGAGGGPRASFVQQPGGLSPLPPAQPVSAAPLPPQAPPKPSPLAQVGQGIKQGAGAVLRSPITMGALGGLSAMEGADEAQTRYAQGDMPGAAIAGAGVIGGGMQMLPSVPTKAFGAMISAASPLTLYLYDKLRGKNAPEPEEPTPEEMMAASRPAFGVYPNPGMRPTFRPRVSQDLPPVEAYR